MHNNIFYYYFMRKYWKYVVKIAKLAILFNGFAHSTCICQIWLSSSNLIRLEGVKHQKSCSEDERTFLRFIVA